MQEVARSRRLPPNNPLLRASCDNVQAPHCCAGVENSGYALRGRRVAAELGR